MVMPMLSASDREMFHRFKVEPEQLEGEVMRVTNEEARTLCGLRAPSSADLSGLAFIYHSLFDDHVVTYRVRRDNPDINSGKEENKYIEAWGNRKHFYAAAHSRRLLKEPDTAIMIVEAEKSAHAGEAWATRQDRKLAVVAMGGCYGYSGRIGKCVNGRGVTVDEKGFISDLDYCNGHTVYVCLDANKSTNKKVKKAEDKLVRELMRRDCRVLICTLPVIDGVNGPDDLIAVAGDAAMAEVFARAVPAKQTCDFGNGRFELNDQGVSYIPNPDNDGNSQPPIWLSAPLQIVAKTRDNQNKSWGRLLEWRDQDHQLHRVALPMELLRRDGGTEALCLLESEGLVIGSGKNVKDYLLTFIRIWPTDYRARCVDKPGWAITSSGIVYVLPSEAIGSAGEPIVFQNAHSVAPAFSSSGTVEEWKQNVAAPAAGTPGWYLQSLSHSPERYWILWARHRVGFICAATPASVRPLRWS